MRARHEWLHVAWPAALLAVFAVAFRGQATNGSRPDSGAECGTSRTADLGVLERCFSLQSDDIELMIDLGGRYESARRWTDAARVYRRALEVDAGDGDIHLRLGEVLLQLGDRQAARREGEACLAVQPRNGAALRLVNGAAATAVKP